MTDTCPENVSAPADEAAAATELRDKLRNEIRAHYASLSKDSLQDIVGMHVQFTEQATPEFRRDFFMRKRIAQELLDEDSPQA